MDKDLWLLLIVALGIAPYAVGLALIALWYIWLPVDWDAVFTLGNIFATWCGGLVVLGMVFSGSK